MALIVVLWTLLLLGVIAASLGGQARKEGYLARNAAALARAEAAADAGVIRGVAALIDPRAELRWAADGSAHRFVLDGISIDIRIVDEAGKVQYRSVSAVRCPVAVDKPIMACRPTIRKTA